MPAVLHPSCRPVARGGRLGRGSPARRSARLFPAGAGEVCVVFSGGLAVGFGLGDARCRNTPQLQARRGAGSRDGRCGEGPRHRPHPSRRGAHGAVGPRGVKDRGEVLGRAGASPGSRCQDLPFQSQGTAEKSLPARGAPQKASSCCCLCHHVRGHICRRYQQHALGGAAGRRRGRSHVSIAVPSSRRDLGAGNIGVSPAPSPRRGGGARASPLESFFE